MTMHDRYLVVQALGCMLYGLCYLGHPFQDGGNLAILSARYKLPTQVCATTH